MATLLLTAVGTLVGGPLGGAIGALAGRQIDGALIGSALREGPHLKELDISTSSYGNPIARHHGISRSGGSIIWATDLVESSESSGGGKGKPSTTSFSYSTSFAVALSSRRIKDVGRIWADGNLLRGAGGDLKTGGTLRLHTGQTGQLPDPLIASAEGASAPAFRGTAYAVFEDLQLGDFGNRIPALTFEIIADTGDIDLAEIVAPAQSSLPLASSLEGLAGFASDGGSTARALAVIGQLYPISVEASGEALSVSTPRLPADPADIPVLSSEAVAAWEEDDFGAGSGIAQRRAASERPQVTGVRHYDPARDYQPGVQRTGGRASSGAPEIIEFPATISAARAKLLAGEATRRRYAEGERIAWRMAEIDPAIHAGSIVRLPGRPGAYRVTSWEWRERAVELELVKLSSANAASSPADPGQIVPPADIAAGPSVLSVFGLPWDGTGSAASAQVFAALTTTPPGSSAMLYSAEQDQLRPLFSVRGNALQGTLEGGLGSSPAMRFEGAASFEARVTGDPGRLAPASIDALAGGANKMLVGTEIIQFATPIDLGDGRWRFEGLLRGRGATEAAAQAGHPSGVRIVFLDDRLASLGSELPGTGTLRLAASAIGDTQPAETIATDADRSLRPLTPVHPRFDRRADGTIALCWTRRARGAWTWPDGVDAPLVEEAERYLVGLGPLDAPVVSWNPDRPALLVAPDIAASLTDAHSGQAIWVRQQGTRALSDALYLGTL